MLSAWLCEASTEDCSEEERFLPPVCKVSSILGEPFELPSFDGFRFPALEVLPETEPRLEASGDEILLPLSGFFGKVPLLRFWLGDLLILAGERELGEVDPLGEGDILDL